MAGLITDRQPTMARPTILPTRDLAITGWTAPGFSMAATAGGSRSIGLRPGLMWAVTTAATAAVRVSGGAGGSAVEAGAEATADSSLLRSGLLRRHRAGGSLSDQTVGVFRKEKTFRNSFGRS